MRESQRERESARARARELECVRERERERETRYASSHSLTLSDLSSFPLFGRLRHLTTLEAKGSMAARSLESTLLPTFVAAQLCLDAGHSLCMSCRLMPLLLSMEPRSLQGLADQMYGSYDDSERGGGGAVSTLRSYLRIFIESAHWDPVQSLSHGSGCTQLL
jgi:hypothetical protein